MLRLGEGEVHPLEELVLQDSGPCGEHLQSEDPKVGIELPGAERPRVGLIAQPFVVVVLDCRRLVGNNDVDDDNVTARFADPGHLRNHRSWIGKMMKRVARRDYVKALSLEGKILYDALLKADVPDPGLLDEALPLLPTLLERPRPERAVRRVRYRFDSG